MTEILMVCLMEHRTARLTKFDLECSKDGTSKGPDGLRVGSIDGRPIRPPMDGNMTEILMVCLMGHQTACLTEFDLECSKDGTSKGPDGLRVGSIDGRNIRTTDEP